MIRQKISVLVFAAILVTFLVLDVHLFHRIQSMVLRPNTTVVFPSITAKQVMLDHVNAYVMSPLSQRLESALSLTTRFPSLTANQISYFGVFVALLASRVLLVSDSLLVKRIAVLVFLVRQFVDDLDGLVARVRMGVDRHKEVSITGTSGYVVDGVCDAIAFTCFLIAIFIQSLRSSRASTTTTAKYKLLGEERAPLTPRLLFRVHVLFGLQMLLSCVLWNRYIEAFHQILEVDITAIKVQIFKSRLQWIIMWAWRCFGNAHQLMNFLLVAVWSARSNQFLASVQSVGFAALIGLAFLTEIHLNDV